MLFLIRFIQRLIIDIVALLVLVFVFVNMFVFFDRHIPMFIAWIITYIIVAYFILPLTIHLTVIITRSGRIPKFTLAKDGLIGDPVNIIFYGDKQKLLKAFDVIGWKEADKLTFKTGYNMLKSIILKKPYPRAPFSNFYLFGRRQDIGLQEDVNNNPIKRHHIRFWAGNFDVIVNPEDVDLWSRKNNVDVENADVWIGSASYDMGVGLDVLTYQLTHRVDHYVDAERDYVIKLLQDADIIDSVNKYEAGKFKIGKYISDGVIYEVRLK